MEDLYGERATKGDKQNLQGMRSEVSRLEALLDAQKEKTAGTDNEKAEDRNSEDETDEEVSNLHLT